jgi:hypothetical protein
MGVYRGVYRGVYMVYYDIKKIYDEMIRIGNDKGLIKDNKMSFEIWKGLFIHLTNIVKPTTQKRWYRIFIDLKYFERENDFMIFLK